MVSTNDLREMAMETAKDRSDAAQVFALLYIGDQLGDISSELHSLQDQVGQLALEVGGLNRG